MKKASLLPLLLTLLSSPSWALELHKRVTFDIPAQQLSTALIRFAQQSDVQVVTMGQKFDSVKSRGIKGEHSLEEALQGLLEGTGFSYRVVGDETVTIVGQHAALEAGAVTGETMRLAQGSARNAAPEKAGDVRERE